MSLQESQKIISALFRVVYNEMITTLTAYLKDCGGEKDLKVVYRWYEDEIIHAVRIKQIYLDDDLKLHIVYNDIDFDVAGGYGAVEVFFDDESYWEEGDNDEIVSDSHEYYFCSKFYLEVMDEIIAYLSF